jgi:membrane protein YqaA with SNARE-associated domain
LPILITLFLSAFTSATLLPGSSEVVLAGVLAAKSAPVGVAVFVATIGNTLGSCVNWGMGRYFAHFRHKSWFPVSQDKFERYAHWYNKWGYWSLLASWVPIIGDPLTVLAGVARTHFALFVVIVFVAKAVRYLFIAGVVSWFW